MARAFLSILKKSLYNVTYPSNNIMTRIDRPRTIRRFLIFFCGSIIRITWASPLATATRTIQELVLFDIIYGILHMYSKQCHCITMSTQTESEQKHQLSNSKERKYCIARGQII